MARTGWASPGLMATQHVEPEDSFETGRRPPAVGRYVSPRGSGEREAVLQVLRDGTYAPASAAVGADGIDLANQ